MLYPVMAMKLLTPKPWLKPTLEAECLYSSQTVMLKAFQWMLFGCEVYGGG